MPRGSQHPPLILTAEEREHLDQLRQSRTAAIRDVQRAQILWRYYAGEKVTLIARALKVTRKSVLKWIDKALQMGATAGLKDTPHKPRDAVITDDAKARVVNLACSKPKDLGYAAELWSRSALAQHLRKNAVAAGFPALAKAGKATVQRILKAQELQPHKKSGTTWSVEILISKPRCGTSCWSIEKWRFRTRLSRRAASGPTSSRFPSMKSPECKRSPIPRPTCRPSLSSIPRSLAIMSMSGLERGPFWRLWICSMDTLPPVSKSAIGALNSSPYSRIWMPITHPPP